MVDLLAKGAEATPRAHEGLAKNETAFGLKPKASSGRRGNARSTVARGASATWTTTPKPTSYFERA